MNGAGCVHRRGPRGRHIVASRCAFRLEQPTRLCIARSRRSRCRPTRQTSSRSLSPTTRQRHRSTCRNSISPLLSGCYAKTSTDSPQGVQGDWRQAQRLGEVLVFLDVDVVPSRSVVESYLRWFERCDAVVPFGFLSFVDMTQMSQAELEVAIRDHDLAAFDQLGRVDDQHWRERTFGETADLQHESSDMFRTLVGASLAVSAEQYASVGGFCDLGVRGIEDIEFGYRLQNNGALLIPDRGALHWHQGGRTMSGDRVAAIRQGRAPFADALLPIGRFRGARPAAGSPVPVVPRLLVHVDPGVVDADVLADQIRLADGADVEVRIGFADDSFVTAFAQVALTAPINWQPGVAAAITRQLVERNLGTLLIVGVAATPVLEVTRTRAIRAERRGDASTLISRKLFPVGVADASKVRLVPEKSGTLARVQTISHRLNGVAVALRERLQLAHRRPRPPESERSTS